MSMGLNEALGTDWFWHWRCSRMWTFMDIRGLWVTLYGLGSSRLLEFYCTCRQKLEYLHIWRLGCDALDHIAQ